MSRSMVRRFIKVYEEIDEPKRASLHGIGIAALYEIATLPPEYRETEHTTSKGETKTPDEMTVRELRELKRQLRQAEHATVHTSYMAAYSEKHFVITSPAHRFNSPNINAA